MPILVTDFDGTFTRRDFFDLIIERHDPRAARESWRRFQAGECTHFEGIAGVFASLRTDEAEADALVDALDPTPETAGAVRRLQAAGWEVVVASAGCRWYIGRLLAKMGLSLTIHASPGVFAPETGLVMKLDPAGPFHHPQTGIDKPAVVRNAMARDAVVAYAGDSDTDREASLLVAPQRRFITSRLGRRLAKEGVPFTKIERWEEIAEYLLDGTGD
ncbi:MAG: 2,3-diketo-5-methylthio-1-phosphopentane phosphatase [bacterium]|nr:2,3-diketo-5-methylthio-1-phosphopentane phosphatase [bacterium]